MPVWKIKVLVIAILTAASDRKACEKSYKLGNKLDRSRIQADLCPFSSSISVILSIFFFQKSDRLLNALTKL
ncbi:hypothetical protein [Nostoc sp. 'Peltigera membranacea cyanobiont' 213]|uniref:hypothetical protein n=1 Tax=Nostoc sp. 'Peltigera membranacea cyanobiont' 213 TaxID=2014530 RepID=UPI00117D7B00|nr:hypothetical protein [Nostoc sp. 'Peltigera membranacea cyanobiont' 213]